MYKVHDNILAVHNPVGHLRSRVSEWGEIRAILKLSTIDYDELQNKSLTLLQ